MPNNVKVTVEWCAEDRARLDRIIELLGRPFCIGGVDLASAALAPDPPGDTGEPGEPGVVTRDDVKALVQKLIAPTTEENKRKTARAFVKRYANKVSEIPDDKLTEVYNGLSEIDKEA